LGGKVAEKRFFFSSIYIYIYITHDSVRFDDLSWQRFSFSPASDSLSTLKMTYSSIKSKDNDLCFVLLTKYWFKAPVFIENKLQRTRRL
jgi:hypothetical protein